MRSFTPLRYPGGKGKLAPFVKDLFRYNNLRDGIYVEPYAGGAGVALSLLLEGYQRHRSRRLCVLVICLKRTRMADGKNFTNTNHCWGVAGAEAHL